MKQIYAAVVLAICVALCMSCSTIISISPPPTPRFVFGPHYKAINSSWEGRVEPFLVSVIDRDAHYYALRFVPEKGKNFIFDDYDDSNEQTFIDLNTLKNLPLRDMDILGFPVGSLPENVRLRVRGKAVEWHGYLGVRMDLTKFQGSAWMAIDPDYGKLTNGYWEATGRSSIAIIVYQVHQIHPNGKATLLWDARNPKYKTVFPKHPDFPGPQVVPYKYPGSPPSNWIEPPLPPGAVRPFATLPPPDMQKPNSD